MLSGVTRLFLFVHILILVLRFYSGLSGRVRTVYLFSVCIVSLLSSMFTASALVWFSSFLKYLLFHFLISLSTLYIWRSSWISLLFKRGILNTYFYDKYIFPVSLAVFKTNRSERMVRNFYAMCTFYNFLNVTLTTIIYDEEDMFVIVCGEERNYCRVGWTAVSEFMTWRLRNDKPQFLHSGLALPAGEIQRKGI
jgi:hypothetical protein